MQSYSLLTPAARATLLEANRERSEKIPHAATCKGAHHETHLRICENLPNRIALDLIGTHVFERTVRNDRRVQSRCLTGLRGDCAVHVWHLREFCARQSLALRSIVFPSNAVIARNASQIGNRLRAAPALAFPSCGNCIEPKILSFWLPVGARTI